MPSFKDRTGEVKYMNCGMKATIIKYNNSHDITVKFEDGTILEHKYYGDFNKGRIENPKYRTDNRSKVGTTNLMKCGLIATLIVYRNNTDVDVQFDDGTIVQHRLFQDFKRGEITHPNLKFNIDKILGQTKTMHCGDTATIIGYRKSNDIDIQFDDGTIVRHCSLSAFKGCRIQHPKYKIVLNNDEAVGRHIIGESNMMSCGLEATIIAYRSSRDIDIQFSDGAIAANKNYGNFRKGKIDHPYTKPSASYAERVIAGFLKAAKIDFQSEWSDATLRGENQKKPLYFDFAIFDNTGNVVLLIEYQGMQHFKEIEMFGGAKSYKRLKMHDQRKKDYAQINHIPLLEIPYSISSLEDIVSFLNGELRNYSAISSFVSPPIRVDSIDISDLNSTRIGETNLMKCGMHATITAYRSSSDIDVQFEDGTILCGVSYRRFVLKDLITKETSNKAKIAKKRIGETNVMKNGMTATIIRYGNAFDIDIQFCDGTIRKNQSYSNFTNGNIGNPNFKK